MRTIVLVLCLLVAAAAGAQQNPAPPSVPKTIDSPSEWDKFKESCRSFQFKSLGGCGELLFTGKPVHIAVGSIAPQNGFGAGLAYVGHKTTKTWRNSWNADAVASGNGSWRAGLYGKLVRTPNRPITVKFGKPKTNSHLTGLPEHAAINLYVQSASLNKLTYFGLGPGSTRADRTFYGMTETIVGANFIKPLNALNASLYGEINGRLVDIRPRHGEPSPSIEQLFTETTAPGLTRHPGALQLGEGIRIRPVFFEDVLRLNYNFAYQQFFAPSTSDFNFQRLTVDLGQQFALYRETRPTQLSNENNGPDECSVEREKCPPISRNLEGSIGFRLYFTGSFRPGLNVVPFYFQPTLGGADINGNPSLSSYQDYRFRAPNVLLLRESFEHSIWGPLGFAFMADEGKVALNRGDLGPNPWVHSFSTGLTLRAGGLPQVWLLFSWGGNEGTHTIANMNTTLLGGSARPSLF